MDKAAHKNLESYISERLGGAIRITKLSPLSGGAIQENWELNFLSRKNEVDSETETVLRKNSVSGIPFSHSRAEEFTLLKLAFESNIKVPKPYFFCDDLSIIGTPFFVMERVKGTASGHSLVKQPADDNLVNDLGKNLACIHAIPINDLVINFLPNIGSSPSLTAIASYRNYLDNLPGAHPAIEWGLTWLERNIPSHEDIVFCHRDYRIGNLMIENGKLSSILDWEFSGVSAPEEDIAWLCAKCWRFGNNEREAGGLGSREAFYLGYQSETGRPVKRDRIFYWEVMAHVRWAVIALHQAKRFLVNGDRNLELALTAHVVPQLELEIMQMTKSS